ncbi:hypothetical protein AEP_00531 [Curvibacter sp. AEP1-3]|uniref:hypothetical protein n=1 Tax=Curvibacter sp. AEP1-3 TaxID=1844971 RepID=UPI000B57EA57|nr:hypothetical protein [Curvibacter sp. AEP1-3]ARV17491.1 hypothetical protein AEP_00531 [Curvibacter sp. AEP1-3]
MRFFKALRMAFAGWMASRARRRQREAGMRSTANSPAAPQPVTMEPIAPQVKGYSLTIPQLICLDYGRDGKPFQADSRGPTIRTIRSLTAKGLLQESKPGWFTITQTGLGILKSRD